MGIYKIIIFSLVFLINIDARPISYSGGTTIMYKSDSMSNSFYAHYSPTYKYSIGIENVDDKFFNESYNYLRLTYLLNRKNTNISQRNLYFQSGISVNNTNNIFFSFLGVGENGRDINTKDKITITVDDGRDIFLRDCYKLQ